MVAMAPVSITQEEQGKAGLKGCLPAGENLFTAWLYCCLFGTSTFTKHKVLSLGKMRKQAGQSPNSCQHSSLPLSNLRIRTVQSSVQELRR